VKDKGRIVGEAMVEISREPLVQLDYFELCDPESLESVDKVQSKVLLALAAWVGKARLIDNTILQG
jgi:pantoate--beta-alanine ligase